MKAYDTYSPSIPEVEEPHVEEHKPLPEASEIFRTEEKPKAGPQPRKKRQPETAQPRKVASGPTVKTRSRKEKVDYVTKTREFVKGETLRWILGLFLGCMAVYLGVAFISYFVTCITDQAEINNTAIGASGEIANYGGEGGARISEFLINECFGIGSFVLIIWLFALSLKQLVGRPRFKTINFTIKCLVALITVSLIVGLLTLGFNSSVNWGGYHGRYVNEFVIHFLGWTGGIILCLFMAGCFVLICMRDVVKWIIKIKSQRAERRRKERERQAEIRERERELEEMRLYEQGDEGYSQVYDNVVENPEGPEENVVFGTEESGVYSSLPDFEDIEYSIPSEEGSPEIDSKLSNQTESSNQAENITEFSRRKEEEPVSKYSEEKETSENESSNFPEISAANNTDNVKENVEDAYSEKIETPETSQPVSRANEVFQSEQIEVPRDDSPLNQIKDESKSNMSEEEDVETVDIEEKVPAGQTNEPDSSTTEAFTSHETPTSGETQNLNKEAVVVASVNPSPQGVTTVPPSSNGEKEDKLDMVINVNHISQTSAKRTVIAPLMPGSFPYKFPPYDLLREGKAMVIIDEDEQQENKDRIEKTLLDFKIPITNIRATIGPTVTLYEIVPDKGVKVASIKRLVDDIALSLSSEGVRIIAPIPGKGTVGIEVANKKRQTVSMRTVIKSKAFQENQFELPVAMGSTISNDVFITDLAKMPHLLVAGATGQGKSVGLNAIIASLLYSKRPDELKFVMIDPKMVEFALYEPIERHYLAKLPDAQDAIITDMTKAVETLNSLVVEMENRYLLLKDIHTKNIIEYNRKIKEGHGNPAAGHRYMPYIVVVVDEFADLIMNVGKEVEKPIARLAQKARAVGIHVIIATQRPSADVITGMIKGNFPSRIAFKVSSGIDSKTILDSTGAQYLIGKGDMLILNNGPITRVQCAFIDTPEVEALCEYISRQPYGQGAYILPEAIQEGGKENESVSLTEVDELLEECAKLVVSSNHGSTSALQRHFSLGYNRAGKIMDQLEALGVVGPPQGGKPRSVLVDMVRLDEIISNMRSRK